MSVIFINPYRFASTQLWTPAQITTALWLDAADSSTITTVSGAVSQWNDKSGNGRHVSQGTAGNRPSYSSTGFNSLPCVTWTSSSQLNFPAGFAQASGQNVIAVVDTTNNGTGYRLFITRTSAATANMAIYFGGSDAAGGGFSYKPMVYWNVNARANWTNTVQSKAIVRWSFATGSPASALTQVNGATPVTETFTASSLTDWSSIGNSATQGSAYAMAELLILPSTPSASVLQQIEGYTAHKWGLAANLPSDHPYKSAAPTI